MFITNDWKDYQLLDAGNGYKLEKWKNFILKRPDPQAIWNSKVLEEWQSFDAEYIRSASGGGEWNFAKRLPDSWTIDFLNCKFIVRPTGFKHTGLFPEQAANWQFMANFIKKHSEKKQFNVLNCFAYTGGASVFLAKHGAHVTHVDAAKGMVQWAKENVSLNKINSENLRYIVEDVKKFVLREIRRGNKYDGIIMDPPSYGRGPNGEVWKLENELSSLVSLASNLIQSKYSFFVLNGYTTGFSQSVLYNVLDRELVQKHGGKLNCDELCLPINCGGYLPCGTTARWINE